MTEPFPHLFQPLTIRHKTLRNRIVFGAHTANMSVEGLPGDRHFAYYRERARGGVGMIVVEPVPPHQSGVLIRGNFRVQDDATIAPFRRITDACHAEGAVMIHQIYHIGANGDSDNSWHANWSPSGTLSVYEADGSHPMTEAEIEEMIEAFVGAARREQASGFDGVELFAAYNALIDQFWSPITNFRDDRWGGSLENRLRFAVEICRRVRKTCGENFIIGMTITGAEPAEGGLTLGDKAEIAAYLDGRGLVDYFAVSTGSYLVDYERIVPGFLYGPMQGPADAEAIRGAVRHARIQAESRIRTPANAEAVLAKGQADMVSLVRAQIADPHLANKAKAGRPEDVRPCISCNQQCIGRRHRDYYISCFVNPSVGHEWIWGEAERTPAKEPKRVLVVGGGPAGMEAARLAAERGHRVTLVERTGELGGQLRLAARQPERHEIADFLGWMERQLGQLQVEVRRNTTLSAAEIAAGGFDEVIVATGANYTKDGVQRALPHVRRMPGADQDNVITIADVLEGRAKPGRRVLVVDDEGGWRGIGTALFLAERGHDVDIVTGLPTAGHRTLANGMGGVLARMVANAKVTSHVRSAVLGIQGNAVTIRYLAARSERVVTVDTVVLATMPTSETALARDLAGLAVAHHAIGDGVAPRKGSLALYEARKLAAGL
ncbi:MAG: FAD-dependent oxidoreductase [Alphaproteobacteria bacterium]|nr:FAD-dependent oxidoreductase [Alphaproteobacteria bacterium]